MRHATIYLETPVHGHVYASTQCLVDPENLGKHAEDFLEAWLITTDCEVHFSIHNGSGIADHAIARVIDGDFVGMKE